MVSPIFHLAQIPHDILIAPGTGWFSLSELNVIPAALRGIYGGYIYLDIAKSKNTAEQIILLIQIHLDMLR